MLFETDFSFWELLLSMLSFTLFIVWLLLLFRVFADIFRSRDLGGVAKALWTVFVIITPFIGVLAYLLVRGGKMASNDARIAAENDAAVRDYIRGAAGGSGVASELERLAALRAQGTIDDNEFAALKAKVIETGSVS